MSPDIQLFQQQQHLPATPDDLLGSSALAAANARGAGGDPGSPIKQLQRLLRGREKLAITFGVLCALAGAIAGWMSQKPQFVSSGVLWIKPNIPSLELSDRVMPFYTYYVQSQTQILVSPPVLQKAVQSTEWKNSGLPANNDSITLLKTNLKVTYPKNSQK